jgi:hypothetical protein
VPAPPISSHIGLEFGTVAEGDVVMTAVPDESHYNAIVDRITTNAHATVLTCDDSVRKHFNDIDR